MKSKILGMLAVGLLVGPMTANAAAITWAFQSTVTDFSIDADDDLELQTGDSFSFRVTFNDAAPLSGNGCVDSQAGLPNPDQCQYLDATLIFSDFMVNGALIGDPTFPPPPTPPGFPCGRNQNGFITVRNDANVSSETVDGISFSRGTCDGTTLFENYAVLLRGPVLDIFTDLSIPTNPDPRLADLQTSLFQACVVRVASGDCASFLQSDITSISRVPEPTTLGLLGLGLAGLGVSRRRKA